MNLKKWLGIPIFNFSDPLLSFSTSFKKGRGGEGEGGRFERVRAFTLLALSV